MTLTIDIPEKLVEHAASLGVPVEALVEQAVNDITEDPLPPGFKRIGPPSTAAQRNEATRVIREIASRNTLGGLKIKDLIEEGRR